MAGQRGVRHEAAARAALDVLIVLCSIVATGWLALGALALATRDVPWVAQAVATAAAGGSAWGRALIDAASASEPPSQAVLDYGFSLLNLVLAGVLLVAGRRTWPVRLLVLALVGSAGAFNLQSHIAARAVESATGLAVGGLHQIVLHGVACAAYITALLVFPTPSWDGLPGGKSVRRGLVTTAAATFLLVGVGTALLPHTISCVLFFGFLVPVVGLLVLPRRIRRGPGAELRTQARLLFSTLVGGFAIAVVLAVVTLLLSQLTDAPDLTLVDPTAHAQGAIAGEPIALLFWFSRLESAAIPVVVLVATTSDRLWAAERWFSRALAVLLVGVVGGGAFVVLRTIAVGLVGAGGSDVLAAVVVALLLGPLYVRAERVVDRLLYGTRPAPYRVLADITALSHLSATDSTSAQAPDLGRVAQAVGLALGARVCRLTVYRPGLRDRTYKWAERSDRFSARDLLDVPVRHGNGEVGLLAVDRQAVSGLTEQRQHLLADIADALGVVLEASRSGIELERQLRAALAHAEEIAVSRRRIVAEMDGERRRIERDLHDGAQHHLVSLRLTLGLVEHHVTTGDLGQARSWLHKLTEQLDAAESVLAATADGVSSLVLSEHGLVAALEAQLGAAHPPVGFDAAGIAPGRRFPAAVEAAVWFCCAESVGNARKHAPDAPVSVRLTERVGVLAFIVHDEGPGFAVDAARRRRRSGSAEPDHAYGGGRRHRDDPVRAGRGYRGGRNGATTRCSGAGRRLGSRRVGHPRVAAVRRRTAPVEPADRAGAGGAPDSVQRLPPHQRRGAGRRADQSARRARARRRSRHVRSQPADAGRGPERRSDGSGPAPGHADRHARRRRGGRGRVPPAPALRPRRGPRAARCAAHRRAHRRHRGAGAGRRAGRRRGPRGGGVRPGPCRPPRLPGRRLRCPGHGRRRRTTSRAGSPPASAVGDRARARSDRPRWRRCSRRAGAARRPPRSVRCPPGAGTGPAWAGRHPGDAGDRAGATQRAGRPAGVDHITIRPRW